MAVSAWYRVEIDTWVIINLFESLLILTGTRDRFSFSKINENEIYDNIHFTVMII